MQLKNDDDMVRINCENCKKSIKKNIRIFLEENKNKKYSKDEIETNFDLNLNEYPRYTINGTMNEFRSSHHHLITHCKFGSINNKKYIIIYVVYVNEYK